MKGWNSINDLPAEDCEVEVLGYFEYENQKTLMPYRRIYNSDMLDKWEFCVDKNTFTLKIMDETGQKEYLELIEFCKENNYTNMEFVITNYKIKGE